MLPALALLLAAAAPPALTEVEPALAVRWRSLPVSSAGEVTLAESPVLRLECDATASRRFGGPAGAVDVPIPVASRTIVLPPALAPTEEAPATVALSARCPTYEAHASIDPYASQMIGAELQRLLRERPSEDDLVRWLEVPHPHRWQEEAALALALPRLAGGAQDLAAGLLELATAPARTSEQAFALVHELASGRSLPGSAGAWAAVAAGGHLDLDVRGQEVVRLGHRAVAPSDSGAPLAWRLQVQFDDDPPLVLLAHAPVLAGAPGVSAPRTQTLVVPPGARRLRVQAGEGSLLIWPVGARAKRALLDPFRPTAQEWLGRAARGEGWPARLATAVLHPGRPAPQPVNGVASALFAVLLARRSGPEAEGLLDAVGQVHAGSALERAALAVIQAMAVRVRAERALASDHPARAVAALLGLAARRPLCDEDAQALLDADAFAEESLSGNPQPLLVVDGLLARRPLDRELALMRERAFRGAARWEELSTEPGPRGDDLRGSAVNFLDPLPTETVSPEHSWFVPAGPGRTVELAAPPLPGHLPLLGLVAVRRPGGAPAVPVRIDGKTFALPAVGPLERIDVALEPGRHTVSAPAGQTEVLVNWGIGDGPGRRWRRYLEVGSAPLPLRNRDIGPGDLLLVAVRVVSRAPVPPFQLIVAGAGAPVVLPVRPGPPVPGTPGELDPDQGATEPVEAVLPISGANATFTVATRGAAAGAQVLVHVATRRRHPVAARERPLPPIAPRIAAALARDQGRANLDAVAAITRRLDGRRGDPGAAAWLARAAALTGVDQTALAREDLVRAVADPRVEGATRQLALAIWRHLEQSGSAFYPETVDRRSAAVESPGLGLALAPLPPLAALSRLLDDRAALRTLDPAALRRRAGDHAVLAAARRAERDGDMLRAAALWHDLASGHDEASRQARAGAALLALPPDPGRDLTAYIELYQATLLDPHDRLAARLLRRAAARTRLRPVHEVDDSAGVVSVEAAEGDPFDTSVEGALLPGPSGDLVTAGRQLTLSFDLASPMSVRLGATVRELRPEGAAALAAPAIALEWSKDGQAAEQVSCGRIRAALCRSPLINLAAGAHSLVVRLAGGLRPAARVLVEQGRGGRSPFDRKAEYLVARPEQPVVVTLFGPGVVETEVRAPASYGRRQVSVAVQPVKGPAPAPVRILLPELPARRLAAYTGEPPAEVTAVETLVLERHETYRIEVRPDRGAVMCRLLLREAGEGAALNSPPAATLRAVGPAPLFPPPDLVHPLRAEVLDGDVAPGWDGAGALTVELGWRTAVDLTERSGEVDLKRAGLATVTYRRLLESLHLTLKLAGEVRLWQGGHPSQAAGADAYFMHPRARWLRLFASVDGVTQSLGKVQASALDANFMVEPIVTLASGLHLVNKLGLTVWAQSRDQLPGALLPLVDPDVFSGYAARHPRALFWEEDLELAPLSDLLIFAGGRVTSRPDLHRPDHASVSAVARTVIGRFFVEAGFRWSWFFAGDDRSQTLLSRRASLALLHTFWIGHRNAVTVGVQAAEHVDLHTPELALRLGWELSNGRRFADHTAVEGENYFYPARGPGREPGRLTVADR